MSVTKIKVFGVIKHECHVNDVSILNNNGGEMLKPGFLIQILPDYRDNGCQFLVRDPTNLVDKYNIAVYKCSNDDYLDVAPELWPYLLAIKKINERVKFVQKVDNNEFDLDMLKLDRDIRIRWPANGNIRNYEFVVSHNGEVNEMGLGHYIGLQIKNKHVPLSEDLKSMSQYYRFGGTGIIVSADWIMLNLYKEDINQILPPVKQRQYKNTSSSSATKNHFEQIRSKWEKGGLWKFHDLSTKKDNNFSNTGTQSSSQPTNFLQNRRMWETGAISKSSDCFTKNSSDIRSPTTATQSSSQPNDTLQNRSMWETGAISKSSDRFTKNSSDTSTPTTATQSRSQSIEFRSSSRNNNNYHNERQLIIDSIRPHHTSNSNQLMGTGGSDSSQNSTTSAQQQTKYESSNQPMRVSHGHATLQMNKRRLKCQFCSQNLDTENTIRLVNCVDLLCKGCIPDVILQQTANNKPPNCPVCERKISDEEIFTLLPDLKEIIMEERLRFDMRPSHSADVTLPHISSNFDHIRESNSSEDFHSDKCSFCIIPIDDENSIVLENCGHAICCECISNVIYFSWQDKMLNCPQCQKQITNEKIRTIHQHFLTEVKNKDSNECGLCCLNLQPECGVILKNCNHSFCYTCIAEIITHQTADNSLPFCLLCQTPITSEELDTYGTESDEEQNQLESTTKEENCSVCLEICQVIFILKHCKHPFCRDCIKQWVDEQQTAGHNPTCPLCREPIALEDL